MFQVALCNHVGSQECIVGLYTVAGCLMVGFVDIH